MEKDNSRLSENVQTTVLALGMGFAGIVSVKAGVDQQRATDRGFEQIRTKESPEVLVAQATVTSYEADQNEEKLRYYQAIDSDDNSYLLIGVGSGLLALAAATVGKYGRGKS